MSLIDAMMEECILMDKVRTPDGEGGFNTEWTEGAEILVAIVNDTSMQARIAESQGVSSTYTLTTKKDVVLDFHDVIKRVSDGKMFRVTSDSTDKASPNVSTLNMRQCSAEKWSL